MPLGDVLKYIIYFVTLCLWINSISSCWLKFDYSRGRGSLWAFIGPVIAVLVVIKILKAL